MGAGFSADRVVIGVGCVGGIMFARGWEIALIQRLDERLDWECGSQLTPGLPPPMSLGAIFSRTIHGIGMGVNISSQQAVDIENPLRVG